MKTIIHSIEKIMNADIHAYSYGIKLSYLLSDEVLVFGDIQYMINYIQLLNKYSLDDKVRVLHEDLKVKYDVILALNIFKKLNIQLDYSYKNKLQRDISIIVNN